jgi:hypothetical protein
VARIVVHPGEPGVLRLEEQVPPDMIRPPVHLHRRQQERFEVLHQPAQPEGLAGR